MSSRRAGVLAPSLLLRVVMRRRLSLAVILLMVFAVVPAASALRFSVTLAPIAVLEAGSLLLLGITFLVLAAVAQRALSS